MTQLHHLRLLVVFCLFTFCGMASGQTTATWTGGGDGISYNDLANWDTNVVPSTGDTADFGATVLTTAVPVTVQFSGDQENAINRFVSSDYTLDFGNPPTSLQYDITDRILVGTRISAIDPGLPNLAELTITGNGIINVGELRITDDIGFGSREGELTVTGSTTVLNAAGNISVGPSGTATMNVNAGAQVHALGNFLLVGVSPGTRSDLNVSGAGSLVATSGQLALGFGAGTEGKLSIDQGGKAQHTFLGVVGSNGIGEISISGLGSEYEAIGQFWVGSGDTGDATIIVENQATLVTRDYVGITTGSNSAQASITITGAGTTWDATTGFIAVGDSGIGVFRTELGAKLNGGFVTIGRNATGIGTATVDGVGSAWNNNASLSIGENGQGSLIIQNGGTVANTWSHIALEADSIGTVKVDGIGSTWTNSSFVQVGNSGFGNLIIQNGGSVSNTWSRIGSNSNAIGVVTVTDAGSSWNLSEHIDIGLSGNGSLFIRNGGTVTNTFTHMAPLAGSSGSATVSGAGSTWDHSNRLIVGISGNGSLTIQNAGVVTNTFSTIGAQASSSSSATISGAGSTWTNTDRMYIGERGHGTLTIQNGGTVTNTWSHIGSKSGSIGTVKVDGTGSAWNNSQHMYVGHFGTGLLTIQNGGTVTNTWSNLGSRAGTSGTVNVDGVGSSWTNSEQLTIGDSGTGSLTIQNGGTVTNTWSRIGSASGSIGTVKVDGTGSTWTNSSFLDVGNSGFGNLVVQNGGAVANTSGNIGVQSGSVGNVIVDGTSSTWNNSEQLTVGSSGVGTLTIQNGGTVLSGGSFSSDSLWNSIGNFSGSTGIVTVDGDGSNWTVEGPVEIGGGGTGTLTIRNSGTVTVAGPVLVNPNLTGSKIVFDNTTLTAEGVFAAADDLEGVGTIDTQGWSFDTTKVIDDPSDLQHQFVFNSLPGQDVTVNIDLSAGIGRLGAGYGGSGSLTITNGMAVSASRTHIGYRVGATGTAIVDGAGSSWTTSDNFAVGHRGNGTLQIFNGGTVVSNAADSNVFAGASIGASGGTGSALVDGNGSTWINTGDMRVGGFSSVGTLTIQNGGAVTSTGSVEVDRFGKNNGSKIVFNNGTLTAGSVLSTASNLQGIGTINTQGWIFGTDAVIGQPSDLQQQLILNALPGQNVTVNIDLTSGNGDLGAGIGDGGSLTIENGMAVTSNRGYVGYRDGSTSTVTVDGVGSSWTTNDRLNVGFVNENGSAALRIMNGGTVVTRDSAAVGLPVGSNGSAIIDGVGSRWTIDDDLNVGGSGVGTLTIQDGGLVTVGTDADFDPFDSASRPTLEFIIGPDGAGLLDVTGSLLLGDNTTLLASYESGVLPIVGEQFTVVTADGGINGTFANEPLLALSGEWLLNWDLQYNANDITLELLSFLLAADFDSSGIVDGADLTAWQTGFGTLTGATLSEGDADGDSDVDGNDFLAWQRSLGVSVPSLASSQTVPEPATSSLFLAAACWLFSRRNRPSLDW